MSDYTKSERLELADLLDEVGPDHPTLCAGWTTGDLVAHLYVRESDPIAIPITALGSDKATDRMHRAKRRRYSELVDAVRNGPPRNSVFAIPKLGNAANLAEYFVHHEDVRRAGTGAAPRVLPPGEEDLFWRRLSTMGRLLARRSPVPLVARTPDGRRAVLKKRKAGDPEAVLVTGKPSELLLFFFGRGGVADVAFDGAPEAIEAVKQAKFGI